MQSIVRGKAGKRVKSAVKVSISHQDTQDKIDRIRVEGKFGNTKHKGTLTPIIAKLTQTSVQVLI